jgi:hypothetical protein
VAHGVTSLYHGFLKYLGEEEVRRRIAAIQLSGRAEDYLVKEFVAFVHDATDGRRFVYTNYPTVLKRASISFHGVGQRATLTPLTTSSFRIRVCHRFKRPLINTVDAFYGQVPVYSIKQVTAKKTTPKNQREPHYWRLVYKFLHTSSKIFAIGGL